MTWRVKSFFADAQIEDYLNSLHIEPEQVRDLHAVVQGPRTGVRVICWLHDDQFAAEEEWVARTAPSRGARGGLATPTA